MTEYIYDEHGRVVRVISEEELISYCYDEHGRHIGTCTQFADVSDPPEQPEPDGASEAEDI